MTTYLALINISNYQICQINIWQHGSILCFQTGVIVNLYMMAYENPITLEELDCILFKTPLNKSPGPDGFPF